MKPSSLAIRTGNRIAPQNRTTILENKVVKTLSFIPTKTHVYIENLYSRTPIDLIFQEI